MQGDSNANPYHQLELAIVTASDPRFVLHLVPVSSIVQCKMALDVHALTPHPLWGADSSVWVRTVVGESYEALRIDEYDRMLVGH